MKAAAARRVQEQKAMAAARRMIADMADLDRYSDPVEALEFAIAYSHELAARLALVVDSIPDDQLAYRGRLGDQVRGELNACQRALSDLRGAAAEALKIGLAERQAGVRERTADMLERARDAALQASGVGLDERARAGPARCSAATSRSHGRSRRSRWRSPQPMADGPSQADRARVVKELDAVAYDLNATAVVLERAGAAAAAGMVERAAAELAAACWVISRAGREAPAG